MFCSLCALIDLDRLYEPSADHRSPSLQQDHGTIWIHKYALIPEDRRSYPHHASYRDLVISAGNGCDLCAMIWMRDVQRRYQDPIDCSVLGWEQLRGLDVLSESEDGLPLVSILNIGSLEKVIYEIDRQSNPQIYCSVGFTEDWYDGWEVEGGPDIGPQELRFYQEGSTNGTAGSRLHSRLAVITDQETSIVGDLIRGRPVNQFPMSIQCLSMIFNWIRCCRGHPGCKQPSDHPLPTRVIDVGPGDGSQDPFLTIADGKEGSWIALSHCWGKRLPLCTTIATEKLWKRRLTNLPPTFQDAVTITRALNIRYLWIDALCIIQDSPQDWAAESSKMGRIYENAFLTLQVDAIDSSVSLLRPRETKDVWLKVPFEMHSENCGGHLFLGSEATDITYSFVNSRAWALQEFVLSPRTLALNASGFTWSCRSDFAVERMPQPYDNWVYKAPQWRTKMDFWNDDGEGNRVLSFDYYLLVCEYMSRDISRETDRLIAWSAMAREIGRQTNWDYVAGLWREDMHRALLWSYEGYGRGFSSYVAPTWSWASQSFLDIGWDDVALDSLPKVYGAVFHDIFSTRDTKFDCSIGQIEVCLVTDDPYGQLKFAQLSVQGQWKRADLLCSHGMPYYVNGNPAKYMYDDNRSTVYIGARSDDYYVQDLSVKVICDFDTLLEDEYSTDEDSNNLNQATDSQKWKARDWSRLSYLQIAKWKCDLNPSGTIWALILQAEDNSNALFRRVGVAQIEDNISYNWERRAVKII